MPTAAEDSSDLLGLVHVDDECRVTVADDVFRENFGHTCDTALGASFPQFFHEAGRACLRDRFAQLLRGRPLAFSVPLTMVDGKGETVDCLVTCASLVSAVHLQCTHCTAAAVVFRDAVNGNPRMPLPAPVALTEIPAHILEGLASGLSTQQLASRLGLSSRGVEYHISNMLRTLKAPNRSALVARAYTLGILSPEHWPPRVRSAPAAPRPGWPPLLTNHANIAPVPANSA
ncbi:LuxR C-terminal-related transcriptional regulator [Streptomyces sp. NBC_01485]|uniref:helix-turn-helix transcriptional regulator n=1 Tax=Streptomyces sp. NBC_01485 TaxID=2903884 RepID=UPI002E321004|nr:LuxR C-terminal-related transcriptional regulator [Streptomyces sp. NBC_01485]